MLHCVVHNICVAIFRVSYERVKFIDPLLATFILSAWWHGFYPGYYFLFIGSALIIKAARKVILVLTLKVFEVVRLPLDKEATPSPFSVSPGNQMGLRCADLVPLHVVSQYHWCMHPQHVFQGNSSTLEVSMSEGDMVT